MNKKEAAKTLFFQGADLDQISKILNTPYHTVSKWSSKEKWKDKKSEKDLVKETSQDILWDLFNHQLKTTQRILNVQKEEMDKGSTSGSIRKLLIPKGDIDALQKLYTTIKTKEVTWDSLVKISIELMQRIENDDLDLAKKVQPLINIWLNEKRELL